MIEPLGIDNVFFTVADLGAAVAFYQRCGLKLKFRIDALLYAEPSPEPLVFDSELEPVNGTIAVRAEGL